jgi:hypothetical protein
MSREDELEEARIKASQAFTEARRLYDMRLRVLRDEAEERMRHEQVGIDFFAAQEASREAERAWRKERDANRERRGTQHVSDLGLAEGDKVREWKPPHYDWNKPYDRTNNVGVIQVFRDGDEGRTGRINHGDLVVRLLKTDGTPGKRIEKWTAQWVKEGVRHPKGAVE